MPTIIAPPFPRIRHTYAKQTGFCDNCGTPEPPKAVWQLVTAASQLQVGDKLILAYAPPQGKLYVMSGDITDKSKIESVEVSTIDSGTTEFTNKPDSAWVITLGMSNGKYTLLYNDSYYIAYNSGTNFKKINKADATPNLTDQNALWTFDAEKLYFVNAQTTSRVIGYHITNTDKNGTTNYYQFAPYSASNFTSTSGSDKYATPVIYRLPAGTTLPETPEHVCQHICPTCNKCTSTCQDPACSEKCAGHSSSGGGESETETLQYTLLFGKSYNDTATGGYTKTWKSTNAGHTWTLTNFHNNNNSWEYVKGGKSPTITSDLMSEKITRIVIYTTEVSSSNQVILEVSSSSTFGTVTQTTKVATNVGEVEISITNPANNNYYRLSFNGTGTKSITITKVEYYGY